MITRLMSELQQIKIFQYFVIWTNISSRLNFPDQCLHLLRMSFNKFLCTQIKNDLPGKELLSLKERPEIRRYKIGGRAGRIYTCETEVEEEERVRNNMGPG